MNAVEIRQLKLSFGKQPLFNDFNFTLPKGHWISLLGRSGVGKSTLIRAIAGFEQKAIQSGCIDFPCHQHHTQKIAFMAQQDGLLPWLSVLDNVQLAQHLNNSKSKESVAQAEYLLHVVQLFEHRHKYCYQLSGGQRQRVALARTLMQSSDVILMDEPFSALDAVTRLQLQNLAYDLLKQKSVLLITHDPQEALRLSDCIYVLQTQKGITELSTPIYPQGTQPRPFTQAEFALLHQKLLSQLMVEDTNEQ